MKLYKKLLIGSLALTLALGHLHAMEGTSFSTDPKPPYSIYESLFVRPCTIRGPRVNDYSNHYKDKDNANLIHRELAGNKIIKHYTKDFGDCFLSHGTWKPLPIPVQLGNGFQLLRVYGEVDLKLFTNILVVNGLFNENTLRHSSIKSLFSLDQKYRNCVIFTTSDKCNFDFIYNQQMFQIPKNDFGNVDNDQLFNNLCKLLESIDVLTIAIRDRSEIYDICTIILNLKELNRETGMCTFVDFKGNEIQTDITFLANLLKKNQVEFMHVHFLDKIPKDKQLKIIYHCLAKEPVSINWHDVKEKEEGSEAEEKDTKEKEESSEAEEKDIKEKEDSSEAEDEDYDEQEGSEAEDEDYDEQEGSEAEEKDTKEKEEISEAEEKDTKEKEEDSSDENLPFEKFLDKYLKRDKELPKDEIMKICDDATEVLKKESSLLKIEGPTIVVGDIHADLGALEYSVRKFLEANGEKNILFLGDYVDRGKGAPGGPNSIKNVAILLKLKTMFPDKVFLLRGNHEDKKVNYFDPSHYTLYNECMKGYGEESGNKIFDKFNDTFNYLSLGAIVNKSTFCVHGGISPRLTDVSKIAEIKKPLSYEQITGEDNALVVDLLWSDPEQLNWDNESNFASDELYECQFLTSRRGAGHIFSKYAASEFIRNNNLKRILRAHQQADGHKDVFKDKSVITLFSVPKYMEVFNNKGAIAEINGENIEYETIDYNRNNIVKP